MAYAEDPTTSPDPFDVGPTAIATSEARCNIITLEMFSNFTFPLIEINFIL